MKAGDVIRLKKFETFLADGRSSFTFVANPNRASREDAHVFVCVVLATEKLQLSAKDEPLDIGACMRALGWQPIPMPAPKKAVKKRSKK